MIRNDTDTLGNDTAWQKQIISSHHSLRYRIVRANELSIYARNRMLNGTA